MPRPLVIVHSLLASLALLGSSAFAQDLTPSKPPGGTEPAKPPAENTPTPKPNDAGGGGLGAGGGAGGGVGGGAVGGSRRNNNPANLQVPNDIQLVRDVVYATVEGKNGQPLELKMDCAFPKESDVAALPVVIYIHGGGWSGGDRTIGLPFAIAFARGNYFACTISYRLSGEAIFPAQLQDVKDAVRFIRGHAEELAIDPDRIGVWGHSAGGHLSALLGVTGNVATFAEPAGARRQSSAVQAVVDVSGPTDLLLIAPDGDGGPMISQLLGGTVRDKQELAKSASPVNHVDAKDAPFLIIQGGQDRLVPDEQAEVMRDALKSAGVECEYLYVREADHGVMDRRAFLATAVFFDKHLGGDATEAIKEIARRLAGGGGSGGGPGAGGARRPNAQQPPVTTQPK